LEYIIAGAEQGDVVSLVAVDKSLPSPPSRTSLPLPPRIVSLPAPPSMVSWISAARLPVVEILSSPPLAFSTSFSLVPISMAKGAGSRRSKRTR
jgi:hypothetical protein